MWAIILDAIFMLVIFCGGINIVYADQMLPAKLSDGTPIQLKIEGDKLRALPKNIVVVCSASAQDDVFKLNAFAKQLLPAETYTIFDGAELPPNFDKKSVTFVFFGKGSNRELKTPCVKAASGFAEYIRLRAKIIQNQKAEINSKLKKQFKSENNVVNEGYCAPDEPVAHINGQAFDWSAQLMSPSKLFCLRAYWTLFGINQLCLTDHCEASEEEAIVKRLGWIHN